MRITATLVLCLANLPAVAGTLTQLTDERAVHFSVTTLDDAGASVFATTTADLGGANPANRSQLARWSATTGAGSLLTTFPEGVHVQRFAASDDGLWVLLVSSSNPTGQNPAKRPQLFLHKTDGTDTRQLTAASPSDPGFAAWALAGSATRAVFSTSADLTGGNPSKHPQLFVVDADGTHLAQLTANTTSAGFTPSISDDGQRIAFLHAGDPTGGNADRSEELFVIQADGTGLAQRTSSSGAAGGTFSAMLSGNGAKIVFDSAEPLTAPNPSGLLQVFVINWDGTGIARLSGTWPASSPSITDAGTVAVYASNRLTLTNQDANAEIFRIGTNGAGEIQLTVTNGPGNASPEIAGGGTRIAFRAMGAVGTLNPDGGDALIAMDTNGGNARLLLEADDAFQDHAVVTADGSRVFFVSTADPLGANPGHLWQLFRIESDGTGLTQVTAFAGHSYLWHPTVSADGGWVAFVANGNPLGQNPTGGSELFAIRGDGTGLRQLTPDQSGSVGPAQGAPAVSADGEWVVFQAAADYTGGNADWSAELFRVKVDGTGMGQVTDDDDSIYKLPRTDGTATWAVFQSRATGLEQVYRLRSDGTGLQQLTADATYGAYEPDISGDGTLVVYASNADPLGTNGGHSSELFVYDTASATLRQLTSDADCLRPRFSGDAQWIVAHCFGSIFGPIPDGGNDAVRIRVSDGFVERAAGLGGRFDGSWRFPTIAVANHDGSVVVFANRFDPADANPDGSGDIFLADFRAPAEIRVGAGAPTLVSWDAEPRARTYDLIRGDVASLAPGGGGTVDLGTVTCVEDDSHDLDNEESEDALQPAPGQVFFYLFRGSQGVLDGPGSYGQGTGGGERLPSSGGCQ
jgi:Tol biopolymer transport system component